MADSTKFTKQEDQLMDERFAIELDILYDLKTLVDIKWDSDTLKQKIENNIEHWERLGKELDKIGFYHEKECQCPICNQRKKRTNDKDED